MERVHAFSSVKTTGGEGSAPKKAAGGSKRVPGGSTLCAFPYWDPTAIFKELRMLLKYNLWPWDGPVPISTCSLALRERFIQNQAILWIHWA